MASLPRSWLWTAERISLLASGMPTSRCACSGAWPSSFLPASTILSAGLGSRSAHRDRARRPISPYWPQISQYSLSAAPMHLDGEFMGPEGAACEWREIALSADAVLIRMTDSLALGTLDSIRSARSWSMSPSLAVLGASRCSCAGESRDRGLPHSASCALGAAARTRHLAEAGSRQPHVDSGSHADMHAPPLFRASAFAIAPFWPLLHLAAPPPAPTWRLCGRSALRQRLPCSRSDRRHQYPSRRHFRPRPPLCGKKRRTRRRTRLRRGFARRDGARAMGRRDSGEARCCCTAMAARRGAASARAAQGRRTAAGFPEASIASACRLSPRQDARRPGDPAAQRVETCFAPDRRRRGYQSAASWRPRRPRPSRSSKLALSWPKGVLPSPTGAIRPPQSTEDSVRRRLSPGGVADLPGSDAASSTPSREAGAS